MLKNDIVLFDTAHNPDCRSSRKIMRAWVVMMMSLDYALSLEFRCDLSRSSLRSSVATVILKNSVEPQRTFCSRWRWQRLPASLGWPRSTRAATTAGNVDSKCLARAALNYVVRASSFAAAGGYGLYGSTACRTGW